MSRKIPADQRIVINTGGPHVHTLGKDHVTQKEKKFNIGWFHKKTGPTDEKEFLIQARLSDPAPRPLFTTATTPTTIAERYGRCKRIIHYGNASTVRLYQKTPTQVFAVKVFHHPRHVGPEHAMMTDLRHPHILETTDVFWDSREDLYLVMEFCAGGDLLSLLLASAAGKLERIEADCFFKQLIRGVEYLHEHGIAHRNLKPESILFTSRGCVKIANFDRAQSVALDSPKKMSRPLRYLSSASTSPYIAPEEYTACELDARKGDIWATGIIYLAMRTGCLFWSVARGEDDIRYETYVKGRAEETFEPVEDLEDVSKEHHWHPKISNLNLTSDLKRSCRNVIYAMLDPNHVHRITASQVLRSEWVQRIVLCNAVEEVYNMRPKLS
jgi:protein-serine/threonine kinase